MFLMLAEAMHLMNVRRAFPGNRFWEFVAFNTTHVPWQGCSLHDLIQPAFSFLVGAAMAFSIVSRTSRGESWNRMLLHAMWRSAALIFLGIFLRSLNSGQTYWTFEDTLTQIGLGYTFLFLLAFTSLRVQVMAFTAILVGFWAAFVLYPLPPEGFDYTQVGVRADWPHLYSGFLAHFNKNSNLSWAFDVWFLNLFPRAKPFLYNGGGWSTLSFIPTLATMMLGLWAGPLADDVAVDDRKAEGPGDRRRRADARRPHPSVAAHQPDHQAHLDLVLHAVQRRPGRADAGGVLCADRVERLEALGVPAAGDWRELDRRLRHELDDGELRVVGAGAASRHGAVPGVRSAVRAGPEGVRRRAGVLADSVLDVSAADFLEDLSRGFAGSRVRGFRSLPAGARRIQTPQLPAEAGSRSCRNLNCARPTATSGGRLRPP